MHAAHRNSFVSLSTLLELGASVTDRDRGGNDALLRWAGSLYVTSGSRQFECLSTLLEKGADIHTRRNDGASPILVSVSCGLAITEALLLHGANPNDVFEDGSGRTVLMEACREEALDIVMLLLDQGADPLMRDREGCTAAEYAGSVEEVNKRAKLIALLELDSAPVQFMMK